MTSGFFAHTRTRAAGALAPGILALSLSLAAPVAMAAPEATDGRPNFLVIVADDLGWSDFGFLGSTIRTPNLDALAASGTFMSDYYVAPTCSPTRSMLMTGVSNHAAGLGTMELAQAPNQLGLREYAAQLHDDVVTVAEMLSAHGYATMMSGKWHLALSEEQLAHRRGFDRSFGLVGGGASHFSDQKNLSRDLSVRYLENGKPAELASDFYSSIGYADKIIEYIDDANEEPFFAYVAFTAPHDPLQVPDDWLDRYEGVFDDGPAKFKERRRQRLIELGLIDADAEMAPTLNFPSWLASYKMPWAERGEQERKEDARRMEIYASMVELLDKEIGRLIGHLKESGQLDNTYIFFMSDNGASTTTPLLYPGNSREWVHENYDLSTEAMGTPGSFTTMGRDWANTSNTPFRLFKGSIAEGGVRSPLIVSGPGVRTGEISQVPSHVTDIVPTIYDIINVDPTEQPLYEGKLHPRGESILSILQEGTFDNERPLVTELFGNRMVRQGKWKAVFLGSPLGSSEWELYDIVADPSATTNLAESHPAVLEEMQAAYADFALLNNVVEPSPPLSIRVDSFYEGECGWWCSFKFTLVNYLAN